MSSGAAGDLTVQRTPSCQGLGFASFVDKADSRGLTCRLCWLRELAPALGAVSTELNPLRLSSSRVKHLWQKQHLLAKCVYLKQYILPSLSLGLRGNSKWK